MIRLLTPEYQTRMTQINYHEAVTNSPQWMASFCYPEGLSRWYTQFAIRGIEIMMTPNQVQILAGVADNFVRKIHIGPAAPVSRYRSGTEKPSDSGTATRLSPGRRTFRAGPRRIRCSSSATRLK